MITLITEFKRGSMKFSEFNVKGPINITIIPPPTKISIHIAKIKIKMFNATKFSHPLKMQ